MLFRFAQMEIRVAFPGHKLYSSGGKSSLQTEQFFSAGVLGPAIGKPPVNIGDCLLYGLVIGLILAWSFRYLIVGSCWVFFLDVPIGGVVLSIMFVRSACRRFRVRNARVLRRVKTPIFKTP